MNPAVRLTVQEILQNRNFQHAKVLAGKNGLHRTVKWIHIMEVTAIEELLNGSEFILSTGVAMSENEELFLSFFKQLIEFGAAGICLELGTYIQAVPKEIIELANRHDFPIIVFNRKVRFVDITQDINTLLINKHYQMISELEEYSNRLNQLLLTSNSQQKILMSLHEHVKMSVLFIPKQGEPLIFSKQTRKIIDQILPQLKDDRKNDERIVRQTIQALNQQLAELIIISDSAPISDYEKLIVDRTATALAQNTLRELYFEVRREASESGWVQGWLDGIHSEDKLTRYLKASDPDMITNGSVVLLLKINQADESSLDLPYLNILLRSIFQSKGFSVFFTTRKRQLILILVNHRKKVDWKVRVQAGIDEMKKAMEMEVEIAVGRMVNQLTEVKKSYQTAEETLMIQDSQTNDFLPSFYEDLYIYRLISIVKDQGVLEDFIEDYIGPLIKYDQEYNGKLIETLKVFFMCNGSKKETASSLFIVRQTLYQRLQKLSELLGDDFMSSYKRQAIEFAITAYHYQTYSNSQ
ncbi:PucR family transcriptional regulator [Neobacillus cucumis]|nr:PucR family transcriptional regulator ligand-binding domain-containing protein [Neobacillus cucumis]